MEAVIIIYTGLIGLLIGSFLNVIIYRLPHAETIVRGRSHCPICNHDLSAPDLVPVFSFLLLGRRCRYCKAPISWRYMIIELSAGIFFAVAALIYHPLDGGIPLILTVNACALFCVLLADSLIQYDGHASQAGKLLVIALVLACGPFVTGLVLNDPGLVSFVDRIVGLAVGLALLFAPKWIRPAQQREGRGILPAACTLPAAGLFLGAKAAMPVLATGLILIVLSTMISRNDQNGSASAWLRRLLPLLVLISFVFTMAFI